MLDTSQNIICSQNGGETISNHSSHQSHPDRTSTTTTTTSINSSNFVITLQQEESFSNNSTAPGANTNKLLATSSQSIEILNSEILNSKLTMSSQEPDELTEDHQEQEANSETQLDVLQLNAIINSHSSDSGCIEDDVNETPGSPGADGEGFPSSISASQFNNDQLSNKSSTVSVVVTIPSPVKAADSKTHEEDEHESRGRVHSVSSRAAAFNKQAEENQKAAAATNVDQVKKKSLYYNFLK